MKILDLPTRKIIYMHYMNLTYNPSKFSTILGPLEEEKPGKKFPGPPRKKDG